MECRLLSPWDQIAPRAYIRLWYCFPHHQIGSLDEVKEKLVLALAGLSRHFPDLKRRIFLLSSKPGHLAIGLSDDTDIPLKVSDERDSFSWTYSQLKSQGFPAKAFVGDSFDPSYRLIEGEQGIPIFEINVRLIEGGLLLGIYGHHSIFDAGRMHTIIKSFAELSKDPTRKLDIATTTDLNRQSQVAGFDLTPIQPAPSFNELVSHCVEYCLLSSPLGPTQFRVPKPGMPSNRTENTGRIFVIQDQVLNDLKKKLAHTTSIDSQKHQPSTYTCLAALTWAHVTKARLSGTLSPSSSLSDRARLMISVDWRQRVAMDTMSPNAGNTIALPIASVSISTILAACNDDQDVACTALKTITRAVDETILSVNNDFVSLRTALFRACPDPRLIGLDFDLCDPRDFYFNTWRHFGTQTSWELPGLMSKDSTGAFAPDAVRRAQAGFTDGAGLVLPASDSAKFETLITLDVDSMSRLCADSNWERWIDHTVR
ncbi:hypothetical protein ACLX1H_000533 [Fusarium chlamydosporum]